MLSNKSIKYIRSLHHKKYREKHRKYIAEGSKIVEEIISMIQSGRHHFQEQPVIYATAEWLKEHYPDERELPEIHIVEYNILKKISTLQTPQPALAIMPAEKAGTYHTQPTRNITIVLDNIQDPGNLGTIMRTADWFGIKNIICSNDSVDSYNPKVIQASMGAFLRVSVNYAPLSDFLESVRGKLPVFGTYTDGSSIFNTELPDKALFVFGNESKGIRDEVTPYITKKITIPRPPGTSRGPESLNISIAHAVVCSELSRRGITYQ